MADSPNPTSILLKNPRGRIVDVEPVRRYKIMVFDPKSRKNVEETREEDLLSQYLADGYTKPNQAEIEEAWPQIYGRPYPGKTKGVPEAKEVKTEPVQENTGDSQSEDLRCPDCNELMTGPEALEAHQKREHGE